MFMFVTFLYNLSGLQTSKGDALLSASKGDGPVTLAVAVTTCHWWNGEMTSAP